MEPQHEITVVGACAFTQFRGDRKAQYQQAADAAYDRLADGGSVEKLKQLWRRPELAGELIDLFRSIPLRLLASRQYKPDRRDAEHHDLSGAADHPTGVADPWLGELIRAEQKATNHTRSPRSSGPRWSAGVDLFSPSDMRARSALE